MRNKALLISGFMALNLFVSACNSTPPPVPNKTASTAPPASTANKPAAGKPGKDSTKVLKPGEKPPDAAKAKGIPEGKKVAVPADWQTVYDQDRGYEFQVPAGTEDDWQSADDVDVYVAKLPKPAQIMVMVVAYKGGSVTEKDDILKNAKSLLEKLGEKDVKFSDTREELNDDYFLVEFSSTDEKGAKTKGKLLMALDKTDNFLMFVASPETEYKNNEKVIDEVWSSFAMYSGGLSGNS